MASNRIQDLTSSQLVNLVDRMLQAIGDPTKSEYPVSPTLATSLGQAKTILASANTAVDNARDAYHAQVQSRLVKEKTCADLAAEVARLCYADSNLSSSMIVAMGLQPRNTSRTKIVPQAPTAVSAAILPTGEIALSWTSGNRYGVTYRIESQVGSGPWTFQTDVTAKKAILSGFPAGTPTAFRVSASRSGKVSAFSPVAVVYSDAASPALRLAA